MFRISTDNPGISRVGVSDLSTKIRYGVTPLCCRNPIPRGRFSQVCNNGVELGGESNLKNSYLLRARMPPITGTGQVAIIAT